MKMQQILERVHDIIKATGRNFVATIDYEKAKNIDLKNGFLLTFADGARSRRSIGSLSIVRTLNITITKEISAELRRTLNITITKEMLSNKKDKLFEAQGKLIEEVRDLILELENDETLQNTADRFFYESDTGLTSSLATNANLYLIDIKFIIEIIRS